MKNRTVYASAEVYVTDADRVTCDGCAFEAENLTTSQSVAQARRHVRETGHTVLRGGYTAQAFGPRPFPAEEASHVQ